MEDIHVYQLVPDHFTNEGQLRGRLRDKLIVLFSQLLSDVHMGCIISTVCSDNSKLIVAETGRRYLSEGIEFGDIIGTATLLIMVTPHGRVGYVHDVVVDECYRGKGIGKMLMQKIITIAQANNLRELNLTTNAQKRPSAEALYLGLGFSKKPTGFYVLKLAQ